ncbi:MAG TPA: NAD(P)-dependent oxidoreductase [Gemmatimonadaceae bacterium]|nr:NAD(P)-dependent oxidoreductase [Gemmatimonadaceae bacterium]
MPKLPARDLEHVLEHARSAFESLRGARILMTGGTGFFGRWMVESLLHANERLGLETSLVLLSRDPQGFERRAPHLAGSRFVSLVEGDVRTFTAPAGRFTHLVHGATDTTGPLNAERPTELLETIVEGTRHTLEIASRTSAGRVLLLSSGAVYGRQPAELTHVPESYAGGPDPLDPLQAYAEGKRLAELLGAIYARDRGLEVVTARAFAFVGPHLPLDAHFAVGNFLRDALDRETIRVGGDGTPYRSYLHAADLAVWLWTLLVRGQSGRAYNVGSEEAVTIRELADAVARAGGTIGRHPTVSIARSADATVPPMRYVPSTRRAREELGLRAQITLDEALTRTIAWLAEQADTLVGAAPSHATAT